MVRVQVHARLHLYSKRFLSQNLQICYKIITSNIMYQNAGTKMHEEVAVLKVVHYKPSKLLVIFSKTTIFKKEYQQSAFNMPKLLYMLNFSLAMRYESVHFNSSKIVLVL